MHDNTVDGVSIYDLGYAVSAVESGTLNRPVSILIQAGFNLAARGDQGGCRHRSIADRELRQWLALMSSRSPLAECVAHAQRYCVSAEGVVLFTFKVLPATGYQKSFCSVALRIHSTRRQTVSVPLRP